MQLSMMQQQPGDHAGHDADQPLHPDESAPQIAAEPSSCTLPGGGDSQDAGFKAPASHTCSKMVEASMS